MKIAYVVGMALGELAQAKALALYTRKKGEQNIFIAKEPKLISAIEGDDFEVIPSRDTLNTLEIVKQIAPDALFMCNSKSVSIPEDPILDRPPQHPRPLICSLDSNWLFSQDKRSYFIAPKWIDRIYIVMPEQIYRMGLVENGGHYKIPEAYKKKIYCSGFVPSGNRVATLAKERTRRGLKLGDQEKLIFVYLGFLEELLAPVLFPVLRDVIENFDRDDKKITVFFKGKYDQADDWLVRKEWFKTEDEFNTYLTSADLLIQHHGLGTLPKAIQDQVPTICLVPEITKDIPYYRHSEFYEIVPFKRLGLCEYLPCSISSRSSNKCMHFFLSEPERHPISNISISAEKLEELLTELLYDEERLKNLQNAQEMNFQSGEKNVYQDLLNSLKIYNNL